MYLFLIEGELLYSIALVSNNHFFLKHRLLGPKPRDVYLVGLDWELGMSNGFLDDTDTAGLGTTLWEPLLFTYLLALGLVMMSCESTSRESYFLQPFFLWISLAHTPGLSDILVFSGSIHTFAQRLLQRSLHKPFPRVCSAYFLLGDPF